MPRVVFDQGLHALRSKFPDRVHGDGTRGARTQPLVLKWAVCIVMLTEGLTVRRAAGIANLGPDHMRKFFHEAMAYLAANEVPRHVYLPRDEAELKRTLL